MDLFVMRNIIIVSLQTKMINRLMTRKFLTFVLMLGCMQVAIAQRFEKTDDGSVKTNAFFSDWFVQMDLDMSLQNPYGYDFSKVFPNGKSFGLDIAVGKCFTPQVSFRSKFNWENALPLLENGHANWLAPFYHPGVNRDEGGYVAFYGDMLLNLHNFFGEYRADRTWNLHFYPRVGLSYNFGASKGALLAGFGFLNTYRLSDRWSIYLDAAYMMCGSGFVGTEGVETTGTGSNSNGYFSIGLGAQMNLGKSHQDAYSVKMDGLWQHWFIQAGLDMSLMNPYGCNFSNVFPKGQTFGVNVSLGKQFTPELAVRGRLYWENGLMKNGSVEWVPPLDEPEKNYSKGGFGIASIDGLLNFTNVVAGYQPDRKWHTIGFVRAGLISQFYEGSASPLMGCGFEETYQLNDKLSLFADLGYQVTTSESSGGFTGMSAPTGNNGFFDIDLGVKISLGKSRFEK